MHVCLAQKDAGYDRERFGRVGFVVGWFTRPERPPVGTGSQLVSPEARLNIQDRSNVTGSITPISDWLDEFAAHSARQAGRHLVKQGLPVLTQPQHSPRVREFEKRVIRSIS